MVSSPVASFTRLLTRLTEMIDSDMCCEKVEKSDAGRATTPPAVVRRRDFTGVLATAALTLAAPALAQGAPSAADLQHPVVLVVGDSLSAEYGISRGAGWVALLEQRMKQKGLKGSVVNASISGDTTSGGRARLPALLKRDRPDIVILELGANDALRGLPLPATRDNLAAMARAATDAGARVVVVGMQIPPNYGSRYSADFHALFKEVADAEQAAYVPFLLAGVADRPDAADWFQGDGIHPLAKAHPVILDNGWPAVAPLLKD